jgi:transcriptional regulator with XRE-family HTH domain
MILKDKNETEERNLRANTVGELLKNMRQKAGFTQLGLATKLSYSTAQFVSNWERGISLPPLDVLPKLCALCKISPKVLVQVIYEYQEELLKLQKKQLMQYVTKTAARKRA